MMMKPLNPVILTLGSLIPRGGVVRVLALDGSNSDWLGVAVCKSLRNEICCRVDAESN